jgi:ribosomal protein S18 acetylase RimI-like enzyme
VIRRATHADLPRIVELFAQVDELHRQALPWLFRKLDEPRTREMLERFIVGSDCATFVASASDGEPVVGVLVVMVREVVKAPIVRPARVADIENLLVDSAARRQGIGKSLVRAALAWSREVHAERTELGVYDFNEGARQFWESMGFETVFRRMARLSEPR